MPSSLEEESAVATDENKEQPTTTTTTTTRGSPLEVRSKVRLLTNANAYLLLYVWCIC